MKLGNQPEPWDGRLLNTTSPSVAVINMFVAGWEGLSWEVPSLMMISSEIWVSLQIATPKLQSSMIYHHFP